jgi:hypothetical protein
MVTFAKLPIWIITSAALTLLCSCSDGERVLSKERAPIHVGGLEIHLDVAGSQLLAVNMNVYQGSDTSVTPVISKSVTLGTPPVLTAFTGSLIPGDYTVTFDGMTSSGIPCFGTGPFTVVAGTTAQTALNVTCSTSATASLAKGSYIFQLNFVEVTNCPELENVSVTPLQTSGVVSLSTEIDSPASSAGTASVQWLDGKTTILSGQSGSFDCSSNSAGTHSITVTATVAGSACTSTVTTDVTCAP